MVVTDEMAESIAEKLRKLIITNKDKLSVTFDRKGVIKIGSTIKVEKAGGVVKISVGLKSTLDEFSDKTSDYFKTPQTKLFPEEEA